MIMGVASMPVTLVNLGKLSNQVPEPIGQRSSLLL